MTLNDCERYNTSCEYILNKLCYKVVRTNFNGKYSQFLFTPKFHTYAFPFGFLICYNKRNVSSPSTRVSKMKTRPAIMWLSSGDHLLHNVTHIKTMG